MPRLGKKLALSAGVTLLMLLVAEFSLCELGYRKHTSFSVEALRREAARRRGLPFDPRSKRQVVLDLRRAGVAAVPNVPSWQFYQEGGYRLSVGGRDVVPLGGISGSATVYCNEDGRYLVYKSDEHGFHNPPGLYQADGGIDLVVLGDSFAQGACVASDKNAAALIRARVPRTLNLGGAGSGPLLMLAALREYGAPLRPRAVLWFYFEGNDLLDLLGEKTGRPAAYLDRGYGGGLIGAQGEIDRGLRRIVEDELRGADPEAAPSRDLPGVLKLRHLRQGLPLLVDALRGYGPGRTRQADFALLTRVAAQARDEVQAFGGRLYLVYLPEHARYRFAGRYSQHDGAEVRRIMGDLHIEIIDVAAAFAAHPDPLSLYVFRLEGHYNEAGYRLVADTVLARLGR